MYCSLMNDTCWTPNPLVRSLLSASEAIEKRLEREVYEASGLSLAQLEFLHELEREGGGLSLGRVAKGLACVRSNATQLADRLEAQGLIRREDDPDDRRCVRAVLTTEGQARLEAGAAARTKMESEIAEAAGDGQLGQILERIHQRFARST